MSEPTLWREARQGEQPTADLWPRKGVQRGMSMVPVPEGALLIEGFDAGVEQMMDAALRPDWRQAFSTRQIKAERTWFGRLLRAAAEGRET